MTECGGLPPLWTSSVNRTNRGAQSQSGTGQPHSIRKRVTWFAILVLVVTAAADAAQQWPQWRGPLGTGVGPDADPPTEWAENDNIRWKTAVPGRGHSTPVVWDDRIFVTSAVPFGDRLEPRYANAPGAHDNLPVTQRHRFDVLAINRQDGRILWRKTVHQTLPHEGGHYTGSLASASPVTDGKHVFAFFGSNGLYCLDWEGNLKWQLELGRMQTKHGHGEGTSPVLHGNTLIVNWDHEGESFTVALDKRTGKERWRVDRNEVTSWATPIVVEYDGRAQVIIPGTSRVRGYNLATGKVIWECGGMSANIVASPVYSDGMLFAGSSYEKRALLAIRLAGAQGDITNSGNVVWRRFRGTPYVPSLLAYEDSLYFLTHFQGILTRVDAKSGRDRPGAFRLGGIRNVYASPVAAAGRVYITDLDGTTLVVSHGDIPRVLAINKLDDSFSASAAVVGRDLILRGEKYLYCIAEH
jgi:outer membrane protein assembly factor BamB